jgi:hypothetical protein
MTVKAKFQCNSIENYQYSKIAKFSAIYGTEGENKDFTTMTPSGQLNITITGDVPAADFFKPGESYYLEFSKAESI